MFSQAFEFRTKDRALVEDHWLAASQHDMVNGPFLYLLNDFVDTDRVSFRFPGSIAGVTKPAAQVAAAGPNENAWGTREDSLPLDTTKNFCDSNHCRYLGRMPSESRPLSMMKSDLLKSSEVVKICDRPR